MTPDPFIMARWADRLESGDYPQGKRALARIKDGKREYCCLGVLCELAVEDEIIPAGISDQWTGDTVKYGIPGRYRRYNDTSVSVLPTAVHEWAGLDRSPVFGDQLLTNANDNGTTFGVIAGWVRIMGAVSHGPVPEAEVQDGS